MSRRFIITTMIVLCGCSGFKSSEQLSLDPALFRGGDGSLRPVTDKLDPNCLERKDFTACLFFKNPVAQERKTVGLNELNGTLNFGVQLRGISRSGELENSFVRILTLHTPRFSVLAPSSFRPKYNEQDSFVEQLSAYYWANLTFEYLRKHIGAGSLPAQPVNIYVDDVFTGVVSQTNSLHLRKSPGEIPKAIQAEVVVHLLGQSLAYSLSSRRLFGATPNQSSCPTNKGCASALAHSFGDYLAAMIFPESPLLGETVSGTVSGQSICGVRRNLISLSSSTNQEIYSACPETGRPSLMGSWYASVWWRVRSQSQGREQVVDQIFFEHARAWTSAWTFTQAKDEALRVSAEKFDGSFQEELGAAFQAAGI